VNPLVEAWNHNRQLYEEKEERLSASFERAKRRLEKHRASYPDWINSVVKPLAKELAELRGMRFEIYGPFGIRCETSIYLLPHNSEKDIVHNPTWSIKLTPRGLLHSDKAEIYYDTGKKKEPLSPKGSIAALNGFDNETAPLPDTVEEINALLRFSPGIKED